MKTLETICGFIKKGFILPKVESTILCIKPTYEERVYVKKHGGTIYTQESGTFDGGPIWHEYFGYRSYYGPSGVYLFSEKLPAGRSETRHWGWTEYGEYQVMSECKPVVTEISTKQRKISGKLFWIPYELQMTEISIPEKAVIFEGTPGYIIGGVRRIKGRV